MSIAGMDKFTVDMPVMRLFYHWPEITLAVENLFISSVAAV
jgi:hypothetical protein